MEGAELVDARAGTQEPGELDSMRVRLLASERDRAAALEREAVLRNELQHRVRNMLAVIRSIFSRTVAAGGSLDEVADHFRGRLDVLARYQQGYIRDLARPTDFETMVRDELQDFRFGDDPRIDMAGPPLQLSVDVAQLLGLALHELVTNSLKFGALATDTGRLKIRWNGKGGKLSLTWEESGVSVVAPAPLHYGFGREFLEQALPYQLTAAVTFQLRPGGVICNITLPLLAEVPEGRLERL